MDDEACRKSDRKKRGRLFRQPLAKLDLFCSLERQRKWNTISPIGVLVATAVVVVQIVRVRDDAEIPADLVPLSRSIPIASPVSQNVFDLRTDIENAPSFVSAVVHISSLSVRAGKLVGRPREPVGKLFEIVVPVVSVTSVVPIVDPIDAAFEVAGTISQALNRTSNVPVVVVAAVAVIVIVATVVIVITVAITVLRRTDRRKGQNYQGQRKNRSYFCKSFHFVSPGINTRGPTRI